MDSPFWTTQEVCDYFRVVRQTIDRWRNRKVRPFPDAAHYGGHPAGPCCFDKSEVLAWAAENGRLRVAKRLPDLPTEGDQRDAAD